MTIWSGARSQLPVVAGRPTVTQLVLLDLARRGQRQNIERYPMLGRLLRRQVLAHVAEKLVLADRLTGSGADERGDHLAHQVIGKPDDRNLTDSRMSEEELLQFARIDVLAASDDHVFEAALDRAVATLVHRAQIARVQPSIAVDGAVRGLG